MRVYEVEIVRQVTQRGFITVPATSRDDAWNIVADDIDNWGEAVDEWDDIGLSRGSEFEVTDVRLADPPEDKEN